MLAKLSIRAKIIAVISVLLVVMAAMGVFAIRQMQAINANAVDIQTNWLPSVRLLGELRANTITYRVVVRSHILAPDAAGKAAAEKTMETVAQSIDKSRKTYEAFITSPEERAIYTEFSELWAAYGAAVQELLVLSRKNDTNESLNLNNVKANPIGMKADGGAEEGRRPQQQGRRCRRPGRQRQLRKRLQDGGCTPRRRRAARHRHRLLPGARYLQRHRLDHHADAGAGQWRPDRGGAAPGRGDRNRRHGRYPAGVQERVGGKKKPPTKRRPSMPTPRSSAPSASTRSPAISKS